MKLTSILRMASASAVVVGLLAAPAAAATWQTGTTLMATNPDLTLVQYSPPYRNNQGWHDRNRHFEVQQHGSDYFMRGHRVYREYHPGYRHYGDWWVPSALFGLFVGSAIMNAPSNYGGDAHVRWCEEHYRSYDVRTDTYQPNHGPRRRCVSPYN